MVTLLLLLEDFDLVFRTGVALTEIAFLLPKTLRQDFIIPLGLPLITVMTWTPFLPLDTEVNRPREPVAAFPKDLPVETPLELRVDVPLVLPLDPPLELPTELPLEPPLELPTEPPLEPPPTEPLLLPP